MDTVVIKDKSLFNLKVSMLLIFGHISINISKLLYFISKYNLINFYKLNHDDN